MSDRRTLIIVTLGPSTLERSHLRRLKAKGVDFVRLNMSHSSLDDLRQAIPLAHEYELPFILDTEGSQVRTGDLITNQLYIEEDETVFVSARPVAGDTPTVPVRPAMALRHLEEGDLIHVDFDSAILRVDDTSRVGEGLIVAKALTCGFVGSNKAVVIDPVVERELPLPALSEKDLASIAVGMAYDVEHIALSFTRSAADILAVRKMTADRMKVIAKIESRDALQRVDEIIEHADCLLIDRGDLSKQVALERIPFIQKIVIEKARRRDVGVFIATNLLESMIERRRPTRAEVHDVVATVLDGAAGLTLAAETAIGKHPLECVNTLTRLICHAEEVMDANDSSSREGGHRLAAVVRRRYLVDSGESSGLVSPHGGHLVTRVSGAVDDDWLASLPRIVVRAEQQVDVEHISSGSYSPLQGFMSEDDFHEVLTNMHLADGTVWPVPIVLDVARDTAASVVVGEHVALVADDSEPFAVLRVEEKFTFDRAMAMRQLYETTDPRHPGVRRIEAMGPVLLGGKVDLVRRRRRSPTRPYELSPRQVRHLFDEKGWLTVLGISIGGSALRPSQIRELVRVAPTVCDGVFIHRIVGTANTSHRDWALPLRTQLATQEVVVVEWTARPRVAGLRGMLLGALCRKNFGCSHSMVSDHVRPRRDSQRTRAVEELCGWLSELGVTAVGREKVAHAQRSRAYC